MSHTLVAKPKRRFGPADEVFYYLARAFRYEHLGVKYSVYGLLELWGLSCYAFSSDEMRKKVELRLC